MLLINLNKCNVTLELTDHYVQYFGNKSLKIINKILFNFNQYLHLKTINAVDDKFSVLFPFKKEENSYL